MHVVSLYDFSGAALRPWADAGYECFAYDIQHAGTECRDGIHFVHADLYDETVWGELVHRHGNVTRFVSAFPVCTDMSVAGACLWAKKRAVDPSFQDTAARRAMLCAQFAEQIGCTRWYVENPVGALSRLWRKPDFRFNPCDYGGYLPADDVHPHYPAIIPARDAYRKRTCIWHGPDFIRPLHRPVEPVVHRRQRADGTVVTQSPMWTYLGGKSARTKNIRSATPRGFARAVFAANRA